MLDFLTAYLSTASIKNQFKFKNNDQAELDRYIASKSPSTAAEVDHWIREYDRKQPSSYWSKGV
jgi:hypothetical protein